MSTTTRRLLQHLPYLFRSRQEPDTVMGRLLQPFEEELDRLHEELQLLNRSTSVQQTPIEVVSEVYCADLPFRIDTETWVAQSSAGEGLDFIQHFEDFLWIRPSDPAYRPEIYKPHPVYYDAETTRIYTRRPYKAVSLFRSHAADAKETFELHPYAIWNPFDEHGLYLGLPRLDRETNRRFQQRLMDVRSLPVTLQREGFLLGLHRRLGLVFEETWENRAVDICLQQPFVVRSSVLVDGRPYTGDTSEETNNQLRLHGHDEQEGQTSRVRYYAGLTAHALSDPAWWSALYKQRASHNDALSDIFHQMRKDMPIRWEDRDWQGYWPMKDTERGTTMIPVRMDIF